ncbi:hypothetical protein [Legionella jamestowniensis]|uniref:Response regulatory domain-containing protein n=1 Tax=Legionella jamestowniensis TaxID=455 RepID=A0A0W0UGK5_9GAMM|nr:hypothetical protein [Legionella jamestowniensis]KTD06968.1 hypothetical protein Ljam_1163 [Legionella jamestowniensis]OCH97532.1 hypothetical protein A8135_14160 [Legionella jamestowniensis]SFM04413.1 hypothetical protein SAMN02746073_0123 [Legionella jamestowniensis DSM 19215]
MLAIAKPKIVLLDDDQSLLEVICYYFHEKFKETVLVEIFSKSQDFFLYIQENCYLSESPSDILNSFYANTKSKEQIKKTLKDLSELSAILVIDQELREENVTGIELSNQIRQYFPSAYISMLTSNIPTDKAVELHNNHSIDLFIDKKDINAIHNLYVYLSKQIDEIKNEYMIDPIDIFEYADIFENDEYLNNKNILLERNNPISFLTLNNDGDIAFMKKNKQISFWKYNSQSKQFTEYE